MIADETGLLAADADVAVQRHVHARTDRWPVYHRDGRLADQRDVAVQLGEAVEEMLARRIRPVMRAAVAGKVRAGDILGGLRSEIGAGTESPPHAGEHDDADVGIVVARAHVLADLGHGAAFLGGSHERVHPFRAVELDPEDAALLRLIEQIFDKRWSHGSLSLDLHPSVARARTPHYPEGGG